MLSAGVECPPDSAAGPPSLMAVSEPGAGLDAEPHVSTPALAHSSRLTSGPYRTLGAEGFGPEAEGLDGVVRGICCAPEEPLTEELLQDGDTEEDEENKRSHRKRGCSSGGCQRRDKEARDAEEDHTECCALTPGERWTKQEDPQPNKHEAKFSTTCCTEAAESLKSRGESQPNVQVTAETLLKPTEEVQGMKADGTRIFSKAGYQNDSVHKVLPPESDECPDVDTVMARAGVSETTMLDFLKPLKVTDIESTTEHSQEKSEYNGLKAHTDMPLRTGGNVVSILENREEKVPRPNPVDEFNTSLDNCQTYQQDEENNAYDFCTVPLPKHNEPDRLSPVKSYRTVSIKSSEVLCSVLKSVCYLDFRNTSLENNSTAIRGLTNETSKRYFPENTANHTDYDRGTGCVENWTSKSVPVGHLSVLRNEELSSDKTDDRKINTGQSYSSEFEEAAEIQGKIAVGGNIEAQESADFKRCHSSAFSSIASSSEEFSKEKLKMVPSEADKCENDQLQFSVSDPWEDDAKENSLLKETDNIASHKVGQTDVCIYNAYSKISPGSHDCQDLTTKLEKDSAEVQLLEKESQSNTTSEEFAGRETNLMCTLNETLPPVARKSREPHCSECPLCTAHEVPSKDKAQDNLSGKESVGSAGTTEEQVAEFVLHKDKFKSSIKPRTFDEPSISSNVSQKNMKSSAGNVEGVDTDLENELITVPCVPNQSVKDQCTTASTSGILSGSTFADDAVLNSHIFKADIEMKIDSLEGEASAGYNSKEAVIFVEERFPLSRRSRLCQDDSGNRGVVLRGINDISSGKNLTYAAEESTATSVGDEISNKNMKAENVKQFDPCKLTDCSEILCYKDEAKDQISMYAVQADEFDKIKTLSSPKAPEGNWRSKSSEQLLGRYLNKKKFVHNFGFCNSPLGLKMREIGIFEKKEMSSFTANPSEYSSSIYGMCPLLSNTNIQARHATQTEKTLSPMESEFLARHSEFCGLVPGSKQHLESLSEGPDTGLQHVAASVEETKLSTVSSQGKEILLKKGDGLPLLVHERVREGGFPGTVKENVVDFDSSNGLRNADCSGCVGFISDVNQEKTTNLKEKENSCERENNETLEESISDSKSQCSQHAFSIKCAKEKAELVFSGDTTQQSLPKMKWLGGDQANTDIVPFLPCSILGSLLHKPENTSVLSEMENRNLRIKSIFNNSCPQLTWEPGKGIDAKKDVGLSHFLKFDVQDSLNETQGDLETPSALNLGISLPQKEKLCMSSENTEICNCYSSSAEICSKDSLVTKAKPLSLTAPVKRKASNIEIPSSEDKKATSSLKGAKSSSVRTRGKERPRDERHSVLTAKGVDVTLPKRAARGEKFKNVCVEEKMGKEVAPRKKLPIHSFVDGKDCLQALLEGSKDSGSKMVTVNTENHEKDFDEIPRSNLNSLSKERKNTTKLASLTGIGPLSEIVQDCQTSDASDTETSPEFKYNTPPTFNPCMSMLSNSCKESLPNCVVHHEECVPYRLNAQSKDNAKEVTRCQDAITSHSVCLENEALGAERLDQIEKCQALKRKKKYEEVEVHGSDKAQQEKKLEYQVKAHVALQPSILYSSELLCSSSNELVMSRNRKFEGPSEEVFVVRSSENKLRSTLQEIKRPKITTDTISSRFLKTQDSEMENLNLKLGYNGILGAFETTNKLRRPLPLKRQPGRTCKKVPTYQLETVRKIKKTKSSAFLEPPSEMPPKQENALLKSLCFAYKSPTVKKEIAMRFIHMPRQRAKRCSLLNSLKFRKCTKEPALLSKLSAMASKLLAPAKSFDSLEPLPYSSEILPVAERYSQRKSKNLLEALSCINRNLHSRWADSWCTKMFSFQSLALYSVGSTKTPFLDFSNNSSSSFLDTPVFPISFHIKLDSSPVTDLTRTTSQRSVNHRPVSGEMPAPPSKWTFSFLLSQSCSDATADKEDSSADNELHSPLSITTPGVVALHPDHGRNAVARRTGRCSMLGLHTVLALSSPGCYRIWTRRRNLTSHIPTIQRLFISQFTQGLKGATNVSDDLVSSLPYSLGRALSIWSQHGPSACPSEITPLHSNHCKWQPSVGIENSYAMLPHLPVQRMEALQAAGPEIHLETSFPLPLPKSCSVSETLPSPPRFPASEPQVHALDEADASIPDSFRSQDDTGLKKTESEKRPKKVSQIRIRKTVPKPDHNLTPMGLPKPKRLKKKEFSLEEIYTNKNYKSPPPARSLETIFEEPKEKNGHLISVSQQKRKRILEFQDFTVPRKRKSRGKIKAVGSFTRAKKAALQSAELDVLLSQKLMDLEAFFAKEAEQEQASTI